jgi:hypothetical protein
MIRAFRRGLRTAAGRWPVALALWLIGVVSGAGFALAAAFWLGDALDASLATKTLLRDLDPNVFVDLYFHHWEGLRMLLPFAILMAAGYLLLWVWLHGVVVVAVRWREATSRAAFRRGLETGPAYARLLLAAVLALAAFSTLVGGATWAGMRWAEGSSTALLGDSLIGGGVMLWSIGYVFLTAVHDHARIRVSATGERALAAYRWAWAFVLRGGERAFALALLLQLSAALLWAGFQLLSRRVPVGALLGVAWSFVWGELFLLVRMWVRVWFFAAQNELH